MIVCGILRAGGDTLYCMFLDVAFNMLLQVPLAYLSVLVFGLPLPVVIAVVAVSDVLKASSVTGDISAKMVNIFTDVEAEE